MVQQNLEIDLNMAKFSINVIASNTISHSEFRYVT